MQSKSVLSIPVILLIATMSLAHGKTIHSKTSEELHAAIASAASGDVIELLPIIYEGDFELGPKDGLVTIMGTTSQDFQKNTIIAANTKAFSISGGTWTIRSLSIESKDIGVEIKGSGNSLASLTIQAVNDGVLIEGNDNIVKSTTIKEASQGIFLNGNRNVIKSVTCNDIHNEGITVKSGEGTRVESTTINMAAQGSRSLVLKKRSSGSDIRSSTFDAIVEVKGDGNQFRSSTFNHAMNLVGCNNAFSSSTIEKLYSTKNCQNNFEISTSINGNSESPINN